MVQVGSEVARRAKGLGFKLIAYDPYASEAKAAAMGVKLVTFDEALASGDFFSLHMPLTPDTTVAPPPPPPSPPPRSLVCCTCCGLQA